MTPSPTNNQTRAMESPLKSPLDKYLHILFNLLKLKLGSNAEHVHYKWLQIQGQRTDWSDQFGS